jgi:hypothetical protein
MPRPLFREISPSLTVLYGTLDGHAKAGGPVFRGSAGSISVRKNQHGVEYLAHRYYGGDGKQKERYLGILGECTEEIERLSSQIEEVKAQIPDLRMLIREGFQAVDAKTYATLASLHLNGLFQAGATLIGSHAFGVLVNQLGVTAAAYATEDVDVARREAMAFEQLPAVSFLEMLQESGIDFIEVPQMDVRQPSSSFKQRGMSRFHVDLLVPSDDSEIHLVPVPELKAHATALPYLSYVLGQTQMATLISREGCCPVRVPQAERFAVHKLIVSQLRTNRDARAEKDVFQASVLLAALGEHFPGAVEAAMASLPRSAMKYVRRVAEKVIDALPAHPRASEEFAAAVDALPID